MGRVDGKVVLVTGAARGQGRAECVRLAEEGAEVIAFDICEAVDDVPYPAATEAELAETGRLVEALDRGVLTRKGDTRSATDLGQAVADGLERFGHIDVVVANAGVCLTAGPAWEITEEQWATQIDINLGGGWRVAKAAIPSMIEAGNGGSIIFTTSGTASRAAGNLAHYASAKSGLLGLCRELATELGPYAIRVNTVQPTAVRTPMFDNEDMWNVFVPGDEFATPEARRERMLEIVPQFHALDVPWVLPEDIANGVLFLASDESKMVTGSPLRVDAGFASK